MRLLSGLETRGSCWMFLNVSLVLSLVEARLSWSTEVTLEASGREPRSLEMQRSCWIILDANVIRNAGLLSATRQLYLSSRSATHIFVVGMCIKDLGLLILDYSSLLMRPAFKVLKLKSFSQNPESFRAFFQNLHRFSPCIWLQNWRLLLPPPAPPWLRPKWVVLLLRKPLFQVKTLQMARHYYEHEEALSS